MLDWLKKFGGNKPWQNKVGLEEKALTLLAEDLDALKELDSDLPARALRYVLDGEDEQFLAQLASSPGAAAALGLVGPRSRSGAISRHAGRGGGARAKFFECVHCPRPEFFVRLGKVYEAAMRLEQSNQSKLAGQIPHLSSLLPPPSFGDPSLDWLEILLVEATQLKLNTWPRSCRSCPALNAELIEAMLQFDGHAPDLLIRAAFRPQLQRFGGPLLEPVCSVLSGFAQSAVRHKGALLEVLDHPDFKQRVYALGLMKNCMVPAEPFAGKLIELALGPSKQVREQAESLLAGIRETVKPLLEEKIIAGANEERAGAVRLLWQWAGDQARAFLEKRLTEEKNKKVLQTIQEALATTALNPSPTVADDTLALPELVPFPSHAPLGSDTERAWRECFDKINLAIAQKPTGRAGFQGGNWKPISADAIAKAFAALQNGSETKAWLQELFPASFDKSLSAPLRTFWQRPELGLVHFVRFLIQVGALKSDREQHPGIVTHGYWLEGFLPLYRRVHPEAGLRELAAAFAAAGLDPGRIGRSLLASYWEIACPFGLPPSHIWPYWIEHLDLLEEVFAPQSGDFMARYEQRRKRRNAFHALRTFPKPPARLTPLLWTLALGPKNERPQAQRCLEGASDKFERLTAALAGGSAESRLAAAEWLGRLGEKKATEALLAALKREKNEATKGAMMGALEQLGAPVEQFLDREGLLKEAEKGLAKGVPEELKWFPFEQLPPVHWADTGNAVEPEIIRWWLVQGFKLKNPEPGALLRRYCANFKPAEREALGQFVLEAWIAEDTAPISRAEAENRAMAHAQQMAHYAQYLFQQAQKNPQAQGTPPQPPLTVEQYYAQTLPSMLKEPKGSAIASKGILSVAGACVGGAAAPVVNRYLKEWYGQRAAQCKALLQMLAWVEHRTATQLLLAVGSRFRTKSIQEEANKQAQALAERKGWTVAELADRTIPSAGLDENGVLTIDYCPRQFTARLNEELELALADSDGKALKSLPDPRKDDDEAKAAEAKKAFSAAKKELKSVLTMQRERLYEAMCTQRIWPFADWNLYLSQHPIVRHHCQRLVWAVVRDDKAVGLFRPLADGSLTDVADEPMTLPEDALIRVAHECQVTPAQSQAWRQHFKDYELEPLFEQFGRPDFKLSEERQSETEISDFQGYTLEAFKLRGRANKLGYTRGQAQDGGWFYDYHKRFPTLGIEAVIQFTGNSLPEENRNIALTSLHFERVAAEGESSGGNAAMMLSEAPPVLLSECWNDLRAIAAEGPGFDPEWEKKTQM